MKHSRTKITSTFLVASAHLTGGIDISHRGGQPGFVAVEADNRLLWPDYAGNMWPVTPNCWLCSGPAGRWIASI